MNSNSGQTTVLDWTLYEISQLTHTNAMTDLIRSHERRTLFPYIGVVKSKRKSLDAKRARMLALKPSYNKRDVSEIVVLGCSLMNREEFFTLNTLIVFAKQNQAPVQLFSVLIPSGTHYLNDTISKPYVYIR